MLLTTPPLNGNFCPAFGTCCRISHGHLGSTGSPWDVSCCIILEFPRVLLNRVRVRVIIYCNGFLFNTSSTTHGVCIFICNSVCDPCCVPMLSIPEGNLPRKSLKQIYLKQFALDLVPITSYSSRPVNNKHFATIT